MQSIAIVADTHIPSRASVLPDWVESAMHSADIVVHAGDFDSREAYEHIESLADELIAVQGNTDPPLGLPEVATIDIEDVTILVTHNTGSLRGYRDRLRLLIAESRPVDLLVAAHSHEATDDHIGGCRFVNPGSATGAPPAELTSMADATVDDGQLELTLRTE